MYIKTLLSVFLILLVGKLSAQEDLLDMLDEGDEDEVVYTSSTFKSTRVVNGHSIEMRKHGVLEMLISHRFGTFNSGISQLYGLDESNVRLGLEYGLYDKLNVGFGRSSFNRFLDGFLKYKITQQSTGGRVMPISIVVLASGAVNTDEFSDINRGSSGNHRLTYTYQLLMARKFSRSFSLQIAPAIVHRNLVTTTEDSNDVITFSTAGRFKLTNRTALNAEYHYQASGAGDNTFNAIAIGFDIETGGHVFQLHVTNAVGMMEKDYLTRTTDDFFDGGIHFGFNVSRVFTVR